MPPDVICGGDCVIELAVVTRETTAGSPPPLHCVAGGAPLPQAVVGRGAGVGRCGLTVTADNWYDWFTLTVTATADNVRDGDRTLRLAVSATHVVGGVRGEARTLADIEVGGGGGGGTGRGGEGGGRGEGRGAHAGRHRGGWAWDGEGRGGGRGEGRGVDAGRHRGGWGWEAWDGEGRGGGGVRGEARTLADLEVGGGGGGGAGWVGRYLGGLCRWLLWVDGRIHGSSMCIQVYVSKTFRRMCVFV